MFYAWNAYLTFPYECILKSLKNLRTILVLTFSWLNINLNTSKKVKVALTWTSTASKQLKNLMFSLEHHLCSQLQNIIQVRFKECWEKKKRKKTNLSLSQISQHLRKNLRYVLSFEKRYANVSVHFLNRVKTFNFVCSFRTLCEHRSQLTLHVLAHVECRPCCRIDMRLLNIE